MRFVFKAMRIYPAVRPYFYDLVLSVRLVALTTDNITKLTPHRGRQAWDDHNERGVAKRN